MVQDFRSPQHKLIIREIMSGKVPVPDLLFDELLTFWAYIQFTPRMVS